MIVVANPVLYSAKMQNPGAFHHLIKLFAVPMIVAIHPRADFGHMQPHLRRSVQFCVPDTGKLIEPAAAQRLPPNPGVDVATLLTIFAVDLHCFNSSHNAVLSPTQGKALHAQLQCGCLQGDRRLVIGCRAEVAKNPVLAL